MASRPVRRRSATARRSHRRQRRQSRRPALGHGAARRDRRGRGTDPQHGSRLRRTGQAAVLKIESFPFTKYGLIRGKVLHVSADAIQDKEKGLVYPAHVELKEKRILAGNNWGELGAVMSVMVEVKTGERRLVEYFLPPVLRYAGEAMKERLCLAILARLQRHSEFLILAPSPRGSQLSRQSLSVIWLARDARG
jgi:hypothetical protein